ncbi:calpain-6 [Ambystoma mexicanum]|uniref:calpain-6 n=1 Tax=Ambystoma mexicanum TaxID=8296 RepID=UPI0037E73FB3
MSSTVTAFKNQKYDELKKRCMEEGRLFEDPEFPATDESLLYSKPPPFRVQWKRPKELCEDPQLFVDGVSSHDLHQGRLGNCWFVAACSCLALKKALWQQVIPDWKQQEWNPRRPHGYVGLFHFRFWSLGQWIDVVIDDRLPTMDGSLIYCRSNKRNEFWSALLEKAYAKFAGSYEALDGGNAADAIVDFTGAVAEPLDIVKGKYREHISEQTKLFEDLMKVHKRGGLISCSIVPSSFNEMEAVTVLGLVKGHAYSVTGIQKVTLEQTFLCFKSEKLFMIRMRNPWGKREWTGAWSDGSEEWTGVRKSERSRMGLTVQDDGEFWMTFEDWCKNFTNVDICRIINTSYFSRHKTWEKKVARGAWTRNENPRLNRCGGCFNNTATFLQNPQYVFNVRKAEDEVLISLQQKDQRIQKKEGKGESYIIGFDILKVELNRKYRIHKIHVQEKEVTSEYINLRTLFMRRVLKRGRYVIIPTTFQPGITSEFILRIFTDVPSQFRELKLDRPKVTCWSQLCGYPKRVTEILVHSVEGLQQQDLSGGADPYLTIKCENEKVVFPVQEDSLSAVFDTRAIFYRKDPTQPIIVQVWNKNFFRDQLLGQVFLPATPSDPRGLQSLPLLDKAGREAADMPGKIKLKVVSSDDLEEL